MEGQERVLSLYAFLVVDDDGTEGVAGVQTGQGWMPLIGADLARVESLRPYAKALAAELGKPLTLAHFSVRTDQERIDP